jgi:hypothetical protein
VRGTPPQNPPPATNKQPASFDALVLDLAEDAAQSFVNAKLNQNPALQALGLLGAAAIAEVSENESAPPPQNAAKPPWWSYIFAPPSAIDAYSQATALQSKLDQRALFESQKEMALHPGSDKGLKQLQALQRRQREEAAGEATVLAEFAVNFNAVELSGGFLRPGSGEFAKPQSTAVKIEEHHPIPKFMGGDKVQDALTKLPKPVHNEFHSLLRDELLKEGFPKNMMGGPAGSRENWLNYFMKNKGSQGKAFDAVRRASSTIDSKYGTNILQDFSQNLKN